MLCSQPVCPRLQAVPWARLGSLAPIGLLAATLLIGCVPLSKPGAFVSRKGDEIVVAGQLVHSGTPVVLWMDPGGYDAYRVERRFAPLSESSWATSRAASKDLGTPNRYGLRREGLTQEQIERVRGGGWDVPLLQNVVDQFVLHYDVSGTSRQCFKVLHDLRCLSVHFMLDLDGTIYQTLDLKERAWHASSANTRSIGIEIANIGAYDPGHDQALNEWYHTDEKGAPFIAIPERLGETGLRTQGFVGRPSRPQPVTGTVQGKTLRQYDFTPEQYAALIKLTATLCKVFPKLKCDYPRDAQGNLVSHQLSDEELGKYSGVLGHYHIQSNKVDPGPAFQWDKLIGQARKFMEKGDPFPERGVLARRLSKPDPH